MPTLKKKLSAAVILAVLSVLVLTASIILYAASPDEILGHCVDVCKIYISHDGAWLACMNGCLYMSLK